MFLLTIQAYLDCIEKGALMKKRQIIQVFFISLAGVSLISLLSAAIKQVRVITDRAGIYSEPTRSNSRIDVVKKGTVLTLFQQKKVREVWYYVSFQSPRYGSRISGFIHESAVEPVVEERASLPKKEKVEPDKLGPPPERALAPQLKEPVWKPTLPIPAAGPPEKEEVRVEETKPMIPIETLTATPLPRSRYFVFSCDGRTCVIVPVFPSNYSGEL
jgi:hypothetical protein